MRGPRIRAIAQPGGGVLAASLILTVLISVAADFNASHLYNPSWPPHAVFHDGAMLHLLVGVSFLALGLLVRPSAEPGVAAFIAWVVPLIFWSPFFWLTSVLPGASLQAVPEAPPQLAGIVVYPNVIAAGVLILLSSFGYRRFRRQGNET